MGQSPCASGIALDESTTAVQSMTDDPNANRVIRLLIENELGDSRMRNVLCEALFPVVRELGAGFRKQLIRAMLLVCLASAAVLTPAGCTPLVADGGDDDSDSSVGTGDSLDPGAPPVVEGEWYRPTVQTTWQWQLQPEANGGEVNTLFDVEVYDIDLFDVRDEVFDELHAAGRKVICYFSAGSYESFRDDAAEFEPSDFGKTLDGFENERWLDIRSANVHRIMRQRLDHAASRGCDGVEPDNVDGYANDTGFPLTGDDQLALNRFLANEAHLRGLAVGLKNDLDQLAELVDYFDFALNEECHEFDECEVLSIFIEVGKPVFNAEYEERLVNSEAERAKLCANSLDLNIRTLILPLDLDDSFRFSCDP